MAEMVWVKTKGRWYSSCRDTLSVFKDKVIATETRVSMHLKNHFKNHLAYVTANFESRLMFLKSTLHPIHFVGH